MMMVATLSSRISFSRGVGSKLWSSIRTDSVSLEIRKLWTSSSNRNKPEGRWSHTVGILLNTQRTAVIDGGVSTLTTPRKPQTCLKQEVAFEDES